METRSKKLKRLVLLLLTIALATWVAARWHVWFGNEPELAAEPFSKPSNVLLTFGDEDELSRNISWQCDTVLRPSFLELIDLVQGDTVRIEAQGEVFASRNGQAAYYIARLRQLKPDHSYRYRAVVGPRLGAAANSSPWYEFQTHVAGRDRFSFLFVGDVQDTIGGIANSLLRDALAHHPDCEFLVCGGDLIERPANQY